MQIEIKLRKVLEDHGLDFHGVTQLIAGDLEVHRHTIRKIYNNQNSNPSLKVLGRLCDWLVDHRVPARSLPQALFGSSISDLWEQLAAPGTVRIYLGEYLQSIGNAQIPWISRRDASVESGLFRLLSTPGVCGDSRPSLDTEYLPFRVDETSGRVMNKELLEQDHAAAKRMYRNLRSELKSLSAILVGSQRINRLVETFVSDLFGCTPFVADSRRTRVPFYLSYQSKLRPVESCFGGLANPPGVRGKAIRGTHYLNSQSKWACFQWIEGKQDSGIVIVSRERRTKGCILAVFGLSGKASEALGRYLISNGKPFWPAYAEKGGRKVGVYICKITYQSDISGKPGDPSYAKDVEVVPIAASILTKYLKAR